MARSIVRISSARLGQNAATVMSPLTRTLLILLLCLTLPLKGLAAAGMGLCGGSASAVLAAQEPAEVHAHAGADHGASHHEEAEGSSPCSHCSPCCAALAPFVCPQLPGLEPAPPGVTPFVLELRLGGPAETFERPPRSFCA